MGCAFGKYGDYSIRGFRPMIHAGSSSTGSTLPVAGTTAR